MSAPIVDTSTLAVHLRQASHPATPPAALSTIMRAYFGLFREHAVIAITAALNPNVALEDLLDVYRGLPSDNDEYGLWHRYFHFAIVWAMFDNPARPLWELEDPALPADMEGMLAVSRWEYLSNNLASKDQLRHLLFQMLRAWMPYLERWSANYSQALGWLDAKEGIAMPGLLGEVDLITLALPSASHKDIAFRKGISREEKDDWARRDQIIEEIDHAMAYLSFVTGEALYKSFDYLLTAAIVNGGIGLVPESQSGTYAGGKAIAGALTEVTYLNLCSCQLEAILWPTP